MDVRVGLYKTEHQRIDAFELWCWRRLLRVPWIGRKSNKSIVKENNLEYSLEGLMLRLKLQYFGHLRWSTDSLEMTLVGERLKAGGEGDDRGQDGWMASPTQWTWVWASSGRWWRTEKPGVLQSMRSQRAGNNWAAEQQQHIKYWSNWSFHTLLAGNKNSTTTRKHSLAVFAKLNILLHTTTHNTTTQHTTQHYLFQFSSVAQSCLILWDPMDCSTPGLPVHHQLPEFTHTYVHCVSDAT